MYHHKSTYLDSDSLEGLLSIRLCLICRQYHYRNTHKSSGANVEMMLVVITVK